MAYLGKTPSQAVRSRYYFTASGSETSLSPSEVTGLSFTDANYVDVSLNGVALVSGTDYTATPSTNTISGLAALTASDVVEIVVYDTFSVFGGNVKGDFNIDGGNLTLGDDDKAIFGDGSDLQIYHDGSNSYVDDAGTGDMFIRGDTNLYVTNLAGDETKIHAASDGSVRLFYNSSEKLETGSGGIDVTGTVTADGLTVAGNVSVDGGTIKLDGNYPTGTNNVALGNTAFDSVTTGAGNVAIGNASGTANTEGDQNTFVGKSSGTANTTGNNNTAIGSEALEANTTASNNTGVGYFALNANTTASNNTAVGSQAAYSNTTGSSNTALGFQAGYTNTTGSNNVAVGNEALLFSTTASNNTAVGHQSLEQNTTGTQNVAMGSLALDANTTANSNVAIGYAALGANTTGAENTAIGTAALDANTTASNNTAVGRSALGANTTGARNTAVGFNALDSTTTTNSNTAVGCQAGEDNVTGTRNTFIGDNAGANSTVSDNTFVGQNSGQAITTGDANTILGRFSGNQGTPNLDIRTASNYIVLSDGDGNPNVFIDGSGRLHTKCFRVGLTNLSGFTDGSALHLGSDGQNPNNITFTNASYKFAASRTGSVLAVNPNGSGYLYEGSNDSSSSATRKFGVETDGDVRNTNNSYGSLSDQSIKQDIADASSQWEDIKNLQVRKFRLIADVEADADAPYHLGLVAQEVETVSPGLVKVEIQHDALKDADGNPILDDDGELQMQETGELKAVKYSILYMKAVKALQEAMERIETLETQRADLEARVTALENA